MPHENRASSAPRETLLVVGGRIDTLRKAVGLGLRVVLLQHREHFVPESAGLATAVVIADYTDWSATEPLVRALHQAYGFTAVISLTEPGLEVVGRVNDLLGLVGTSYQTAHVLKDKLAMRELLEQAGGAAGQASVKAAEAADPQALQAFGERHGYPFIVKPADITASLGVHRVDGPEQIPAVWAAVEALRTDPEFKWGSFFTVGKHVVEQYIEGPEYSVEAFSFAGRHVVVAVTEKLTDGFIELGHAEPARLDPEHERELIECTEAFLDAVGLRDGASHTEVKLSPRGPRIIEGHNRIGGDRIVDLLELAYGIDFELWTVGWPFRLVEPPAARPEPSRAAATRFLLAPPGVVDKTAGLDEVREQPDVFAADLTVAPGDTVAAGSNWDRAGQIVVTAPDTEGALARLARLSAQIEIVVAPAAAGGSAPCPEDAQ